MHACNPVYIVYTHENIVNEFFIKEEMKAKEKRNYNNILYNGGSGPPLENSNFSNSHRKIPEPPPIPVTDFINIRWHQFLWIL